MPERDRMTPEQRLERAARRTLQEAQALEMQLDKDGWAHDMDATELLERQDAIDALYRRGLDQAQQVSASFYERQALLYGIETPVGREVYGLDQPLMRPVEDLQQSIDTSDGWGL